MVSFNCDGCGDVVKKPKLDQHFNRCRAPVTCLDCSVQFGNPGQWKGHTTCVSEAQKYEKTVYRGEPGKKGKGKANAQQPKAPAAPAPVAAAAPEPVAAAAPAAPAPASSKRKAEEAPEAESKPKKEKKDDATKAARKAEKAAAKAAKKAEAAAAAAPAPAAAPEPVVAVGERKETEEEKAARKAAKKAAKEAKKLTAAEDSTASTSASTLASPPAEVAAPEVTRSAPKLRASAPTTLGMGPTTAPTAYTAPLHSLGSTTRISGGRVKQRLVGAASTRNTRWSANTSLPGHKMLASMGWSAGQGLGGGERGGAAPVAVAFKLDKTGIGAARHEREARAAGKPDAWIGGGGELGGLFERLNAVASASASPAPASTPEVETEAIPFAASSSEERKRKRDETAEEKAARKAAEKAEKETRKAEEKAQKKRAKKALLTADPKLATAAKEAKVDVAAGRPIRQAARAKFLRAKRMVGIDAASVNEILGIVSTPGTPQTLPGTPSAGPSTRASPAPESSTDTAAARKEARKAVKAKEAEEAARASAAAVEAGARPNSMKAVTESLDTSADPSFQAGGGGKVSHLSVQQYLEQKLMLRRAQVARAKRATADQEEAKIWARAATVGTGIAS